MTAGTQCNEKKMVNKKLYKRLPKTVILLLKKLLDSCWHNEIETVAVQSNLHRDARFNPPLEVCEQNDQRWSPIYIKIILKIRLCGTTSTQIKMYDAWMERTRARSSEKITKIP